MRKTILVLAASMMAACSGSKPVTILIGDYSGDNVPTEVQIECEAAGIDTTLAVVEGKFRFEMPTTISATAAVISDELGVTVFVPDGSTITFSGSEAVSSDPKGVHSKFVGQSKWNEEFMKNFSTRQNEILSDSLASQEAMMEIYQAFYAEQNEAYIQHHKQLFDENKDNVLSVLAIRELIEDYTPSELMEMIAGLSNEVAANSTIVRISEALSVRLSTDEGCMFTDFEIDQTYDIHKGYTGGRVRPGLEVERTVKMPTVKFSDYVGRGKYMLVDFWASWCGPCKREIPNIKNVYEKYHGEDFDVLSVAVWDEPQASIDTAKAYGIKWNQIINAKSIPTEIYGIQGIPHIILFGPDGTILKRDLREEGIEEEVAKHVSAK